MRNGCQFLSLVFKKNTKDKMVFFGEEYHFYIKIYHKTWLKGIASFS